MALIMTMEMSLEPLISGDADEQAWEVGVANGRFTVVGALDEAFLTACGMWFNANKWHFVHDELKAQKLKMTISQRG